MIADSSMSPVKVLLWSADGSGEHYSGPASFTYRLYSSAPPGHVEVTLAHGYRKQDTYSLFQGQYHVSELGPKPWDRMRFIHKGYRWLDNHLGDFDVLHGISAFHHSVLPAAHAQRKGLPSVIFVSNHNTQLGDRSGWKKLLGMPRKRRKLVPELSGLIAMSQDIYEELRSYGIPEEKIARIPMGVNTDVFYPLKDVSSRSVIRKDLGWLDLPTIIFVGDIVRRKRPDILIEAVGLLRKEGIDCQVAIVGPENEPGYSKQMKQRANELGVSDRVVWFGFTRNIAPIFHAADFFALPSVNEGMAAALIESMASGLPPIVTPVSGSADVVEDGINGRIVRPDANQISDVLAQYIREPNLATAHGRLSREKIMNGFSNEAVFAAYERMFRRVMKGQPAAE